MLGSATPVEEDSGTLEAVLEAAGLGEEVHMANARTVLLSKVLVAEGEQASLAEDRTSDPV